jgi:septal ring-binding cell division protein DamX
MSQATTSVQRSRYSDGPDRFGGSRVLGATLLLTALTACSTSLSSPAWAQDPDVPKKSADVAILIVSDEGNAAMLVREKALIGEMARTLKKQQRVQILSYHFNKPRERTYCEKKLNILSEDLLFVGVVSLADRVPKKVLYRLDRIVSPARAANDVLARSDELLGIVPAATASTTVAAPTVPETPVVSTPSPQTPPTGHVNSVSSKSKLSASGNWRVQLGVFSAMKNAQEVIDQLKKKGYEGKVDKADDKLKVYVGPYANKEDAQQGAAELRGDGFDKGFVVEAK